jgi:hypothetical protein
MLKRKEYIDEIFGRLSYFSKNIEEKSRNGFTDENQYAEDTICGLLNLILDINLINLNKDRPNYPGIDLGDVKKGVCFQVSATKSPRKIQKSINTVIQEGDHKRFPKFRFFVLTKRQERYDKSFELQEKLEFDPKNDVWDTSMVIRHINRISELDKLGAISDLVKKEIPYPGDQIESEYPPIDVAKNRPMLSRSIRGASSGSSGGRWTLTLKNDGEVFQPIEIRNISDNIFQPTFTKSNIREGMTLTIEGSVKPGFNANLIDFHFTLRVKNLLGQLYDLPLDKKNGRNPTYELSSDPILVTKNDS